MLFSRMISTTSYRAKRKHRWNKINLQHFLFLSNNAHKSSLWVQFTSVEGLISVYLHRKSSLNAHPCGICHLLSSSVVAPYFSVWTSRSFQKSPNWFNLESQRFLLSSGCSWGQSLSWYSPLQVQQLYILLLWYNSSCVVENMSYFSRNVSKRILLLLV